MASGTFKCERGCWIMGGKKRYKSKQWYKRGKYVYI